MTGKDSSPVSQQEEYEVTVDICSLKVDRDFCLSLLGENVSSFFQSSVRFRYLGFIELAQDERNKYHSSELKKNRVK